MPEPKPQLFISHSTSEDAAARQTLESLAEAIGDACLLLFDRTTLKPGDDWRSAINVWTGTCDAAVLFITADALASEYCQYEWSILAYRHRLVPAFPVVPIHVGVDRDQLRDKPQQITELQDAVVFESVAKAAAAIRGVLGTVEGGDTPSELQAELIATLLQQNVVRPDLLKPVAKLTRFELGTWTPFQDAWKAFALRLMGIGLSKATIALRELKVHFNRTSADLSDLHRLVATSWVDLCAAGIIHNARGAAAAPAFGLNADDVRTAALYVLHASGRSPSDPWMLAELHGTFADLASLLQGATAALAQKLQLENPLAASADDVRQELAVQAKYAQPVFLAMPAAAIDRPWLAELRRAFPSVSIFLLTGERGWPQLAVPDVVELTPPIARGFEAKFWGDYDESKKVLTGR